jgi:hypothetical protein
VGFRFCRCSTAASRATTSHRVCRTSARWRTASSGTQQCRHRRRAVAPAFLIRAITFENCTGREIDVGQRGMRSWLEFNCQRRNRCRRRWWSRYVSRACSGGDHRDGEQQYPLRHCRRALFTFHMQLQISEGSPRTQHVPLLVGHQNLQSDPDPTLAGNLASTLSPSIPYR